MEFPTKRSQTVLRYLRHLSSNSLFRPAKSTSMCGLKDLAQVGYEVSASGEVHVLNKAPGSRVDNEFGRAMECFDRGRTGDEPMALQPMECDGRVGIQPPNHSLTEPPVR